MSDHSRRAFLGLAQGAIVAAAVGTLAVPFIEGAEAMPIAPLPKQVKENLVVKAQWGHPHRPPLHRGRRHRRRRWHCWWHRGRRHCGWRWF
jgi:hypothetical protein